MSEVESETREGFRYYRHGIPQWVYDTHRWQYGGRYAVEQPKYASWQRGILRAVSVCGTALARMGGVAATTQRTR